MHALESPFPMDVDYQLEPADDGRTRASIRIRGSGGSVYGMPGSSRHRWSAAQSWETLVA